MYFDDGLYFNQVGVEGPDVLFSFGGRGDEIRDLVRVERTVTEVHPTLYFPLAQEVEAEDTDGRVLRMQGRAIAASPIVAWPHASAYDSVYRWETDAGQVGHGPCQGIWFEAYQHEMRSQSKAPRRRP